MTTECHQEFSMKREPTCTLQLNDRNGHLNVETRRMMYGDMNHAADAERKIDHIYHF